MTLIERWRVENWGRGWSVVDVEKRIPIERARCTRREDAELIVAALNNNGGAVAGRVHIEALHGALGDLSNDIDGYLDVADVIAAVHNGVPRGAPGCTCGTPPFAPPEPASDCPHHGNRQVDRLSVIGRCKMHQREDCDECYDWRTRALNAEASAQRWQAEVNATRQQLQGAVSTLERIAQRGPGRTRPDWRATMAREWLEANGHATPQGGQS